MNIKEIKKEALLARICATRQIMGEDAAQAAAESINQLLKEKEEINILFAADRKSTRLNSSHSGQSRMPSSA